FGYNRNHEMDQNLSFSGFNPNSNDFFIKHKISNEFDSLLFFDRDITQIEKVINEGSMRHWSFGGAMAVSPNVDLGISLDLYGGSAEYQWDYYQEDTQGIYNDPNLYDSIYTDFYSYQLINSVNTDYSAWGIKIGGTFKILPSLQLGMTMGLPVTYTVKEKHSQNDKLIYDDGFVDDFDYGSGQFEYKIKVPYYFDAGIGFTTELISLGAGMRYRDWSQLRFDIAEGDDMTADNSNLLAENNEIRSKLQATVNYHAGGEIFIKNLKTKLRAGYAYKPYPVKDAHEDLNREYFTGGIGFEVDQYITLDLAFVKTLWTQYSSDAWAPGDVKEEINKSKVMLGITYKF
ncbi:MAG: outer membrane protein transport protein, partial [Calditrichia bacterium]|nr:outer membrane protein transport protein [Calditrichia bacterium]